MSSIDALVCDVQHALRHLYDPDALRQSPLACLVDTQVDQDIGVSLRHLLCDTIRAMRPEDTIPPDTRPWRDYHVLFHRYVRGYTQLEVADQVGLSVRHLRREEHKAVVSLARAILEGSVAGSWDYPAQQRTHDVLQDPPTVEAELSWLSGDSEATPCDLARVVLEGIELITPMAEQFGISIRYAEPEQDCLVTINKVAVRQTLMILLSLALRHANKESIELSLRDKDWLVELEILAHVKESDIAPLSPEDSESIALVRRIVEAGGGNLNLGLGSASLRMILSFPAVEKIPILVIEDNIDTVRLIGHCLMGTPYQVHSSLDIDHAFELASCYAPRAIILDVFMPEVDGWECLQRLRQHPVTRHIPVLVCTILTERELALSLGAMAYVHKPFKRQELCRALDHLVDQAVKEGQ